MVKEVVLEGGQRSRRFKTTGACKQIQIRLNQSHMTVGLRMVGTLSSVSPCLFWCPTLDPNWPRESGLARPWSGSSPLTPLVTRRSTHFLMSLFDPVIKARDQTERPREQEKTGSTRRTAGSFLAGEVSHSWLRSFKCCFSHQQTKENKTKLQSVCGIYTGKNLVWSKKVSSVRGYTSCKKKSKICPLCGSDRFVWPWSLSFTP